MADHDRELDENGTAGGNSGRLAAHERLSTGALARWMRACASHPWRVVLAWLAIIAGLVVLVATVGGSLKDEFEIPGSDTQRATDLIEAEFASEQGCVLNLVFAAPEGERLDTPERKAAIEDGDREAQDVRVRSDRGHGRHRQRRRPVQRQHASPTAVVSRTRRRSSSDVIETKDRSRVVAVQDAVARRSSPSAVTSSSSTATPSSRRSSRGRRSCSASSPRSSCS